MTGNQSPDPWTRPIEPTWRDLGWLVPLVLVALFELIRARIAFARFAAADITQRNAAAARLTSSAPPRSTNQRWLARVAFVIPRIADRLPWRSDCLVQAIAAQNWLARHGLASAIEIGVEKSDHSRQAVPFAAHAWLVHDDKVITGGDLTRYERLLGDSSLNIFDQ